MTIVGVTNVLQQNKIVLPIATPVVVLIIVPGNFVFLIVTEFRESLAVCNGEGDKITHLLRQIYVFNGCTNYNNY
jgi:hypothetical protein